MLLFLWAGLPALVAGLLVWRFVRSVRDRTPAGRAVTIAAPLAVAAGIAYAVEFPGLVRQLHSSTAALSYLTLPLLAAIVAGFAFAVVFSAAFLVLDRRRELARTAAAAGLVALGGVAVAAAALLDRLDSVVDSRDATRAQLREAHASYERFAVAEAPIAALLLKTGARSLLARVADHPHCPEDVWSKLVADRNPAVSSRALRNPAIAPSALRAIATQATPAVRAGLAANPATPADILRGYARDGDVDRVLWSNPALPEDVAGVVLGRVAASADVYRRAAVASSPRAPADLLAALGRDASPIVRERVALNEHAPADLLIALAGDPEPQVRHGAARNRSTPAATLAQLADDPDEGVRSMARSNPARKR
jgi:hypothetical protein